MDTSSACFLCLAMLDLDQFIADCRAALAQESPAAAIRDLTARAVSRPATVAGWFGVPCRSGLFPLHQSPQLATRARGDISNRLTEFTGAIHIYGGDFFGTPRSEWSPDTFTERPFDIERARRTFDDANKHWSSEGRRP